MDRLTVTSLKVHWGIMNRRNKACRQSMGLLAQSGRPNAVDKRYQTVQDAAEVSAGSIWPRLEYLDRWCSAMRKSTLPDWEDSEGKDTAGRGCLLNQCVVGSSWNIWHFRLIGSLMKGLKTNYRFGLCLMPTESILLWRMNEVFHYYRGSLLPQLQHNQNCCTIWFFSMKRLLGELAHTSSWGRQDSICISCPQPSFRDNTHPAISSSPLNFLCFSQLWLKTFSALLPGSDTIPSSIPSSVLISDPLWPLFAFH